MKTKTYIKLITTGFILITFLTGIYSQTSDWSFRNPSPQNDFYSIKFFDRNTGYVIGSGGIILKNTSGSNSWTNIPGYTVRDLYGMHFFNVNSGYIVGDGGIVSYTSNGGVSWTSVATNYGYALRSITFINQNTGFMVGDHGEFYKTTSGITGWIPSSITSTNLRSVFFYDSLNGYVCGDSGKFFKTTNCGLNWSEHTVGTNNLMCVYFTNTLTGFMGSASQSTESPAYRTTDGGANWNQITFFRIGSSWFSVKFKDQDTGFFAGENNLIMRTTNKGLNWLEIGLPASSSLRDICAIDSSFFICGTNGWVTRYTPTDFTCLAGSKEDFFTISFLNEHTGITAGGHQFLKTVNSGLNWNIEMIGTHSWEEGHSTYPSGVFMFSPISTFRIMHHYQAGWYPSEYLEKSTDGGLTWLYGYGSYGLMYVNGIDEVNGTAYVSITSSPSLIIKSNGNTWDTVYISSTVSPGKLSFSNVNTGVVINGNTNKSLLRTTNTGGNWNVINSPSTKTINAVKLLSSGTGFLAGDSSLIGKTSDFGLSWSIIPQANNIRYNKIQFMNDNTGYLIGNQNMYYTGDGGTTIIPVTSLGNVVPRDISFIDAYTGFVCGDSGVVLKTTNGGLTFINQTGNIIPETFSLSQNYPNPFNPTTTIKFSIPHASFNNGLQLLVQVTIYDILGREITTLVNERLQPGSYSVTWDAASYPSGVYLYKIIVGDASASLSTGFSETKKMVLVK